jgi:hypothetical protein
LDNHPVANHPQPLLDGRDATFVAHELGSGLIGMTRSGIRIFS